MHPDPIDSHTLRTVNSVYVCIAVLWSRIHNSLRMVVLLHAWLHFTLCRECISFRFTKLSLALLCFVVHNILTLDAHNGSWCEWTYRERALQSKRNVGEWGSDMRSTGFSEFQEISAVKLKYGTINENARVCENWEHRKLHHEQSVPWPTSAREQTNKPQAFHIRN